MPLILALNMMDEADAAGIHVDPHRLARILGVDAVCTVATRGTGLEEIRNRLLDPRPASDQIRYNGVIESAVQDITALLPASWSGPRGIALALLAGDGEVLGSRELRAGVWEQIEEIRRRTDACYDEPLAYVVTRQRLNYADCLLAEVYRPPAERRAGHLEWLGHLVIHLLWGWPFLALVLVALYCFVGVSGVGTLVDWMEGVFFGHWLNPLVTNLVAFVPIPLVREFLVGEYGLVTMALSCGIAIVIPIVFTFFLAFSLLEDSGYLPRLAVMANRPFQAMGLNGKAVLPMVLGLGCDTMATLTTRILETRKERVQTTLLLALGVPCSAQLGVIMGMAAVLTRQAILVWLAIVLLTLFIVGWLATRILPGKSSDFILELQPVRRPQLGSILLKTIVRLEWYLKKVLPLFIVGSAILFALDLMGLLTIFKRWMTLLVKGLLGLPAETAGVFLIGFLRRDSGAAGLFSLARQGLLTTNQLLVSLVVITLFIPCIANLLMIIREHGRRMAFWVAATVFPLAFAIGGLLNQIITRLNIHF